MWRSTWARVRAHGKERHAERTSFAEYSFLIALKTEAACGHCPLSFHCLRGKSIIVECATSNGVRRNFFGIAVCRRCYCVFFRWQSERFVCGLLRKGQHALAAAVGARGPAAVKYALGGERINLMTGSCAKQFPRPHLYTPGAAAQFAVSIGGGDAHDCFDVFENSIDAAY